MDGGVKITLDVQLNRSQVNTKNSMVESGEIQIDLKIEVLMSTTHPTE